MTEGGEGGGGGSTQQPPPACAIINFCEGGREGIPLKITGIPKYVSLATPLVPRLVSSLFLRREKKPGNEDVLTPSHEEIVFGISDRMKAVCMEEIQSECIYSTPRQGSAGCEVEKN